MRSERMAFDFKKEYRELYLPKTSPVIVTIPRMNYIAVHGCGDPNEEGGAYKQAIGLLFAAAYTLKMSKRNGHTIEGYFDYVVPPLEGFWKQDGIQGIDYSRKADFQWTSVIRLPDFVTEEDVRWAVGEASLKKNPDCKKVEFMTVDEGLCVQCMHIGTYDAEPETVRRMHDFAEQEGYEPELTENRRHHEIYLSDPRKTEPAKRKTVIRHPVRRKEC